MIIEQNTNYAYKLKYMDNPSFDKVRDLSTRFYRELPQALQDELFEALNRGIDILDSEPQMTAYLYAFGMMHQAKLQYAFGKLPDEFLSQTEIEIIDYGCGQAIGTMCYADFLRTNGYSQKVTSITLIEPSEICLKRAALHASVFFPDAEIKTVNKTFDDLLEDDIVCREETPTLHILSNVLDMTCFNLDKFSGLIKDCLKGYNQFVCVGPYFKNDQRDDQIQEFASYFCDDAFYELKDKKELNPEKDWTCAVCLFFVGLKYKIIEERKFPAEVIANIKSVEVIEDDTGNLQACFYLHYGGIIYKQLSETCKAVKGDRIKVESLKAMELSNGAHHIVRVDGEVMNPLEYKIIREEKFPKDVVANIKSVEVIEDNSDENELNRIRSLYRKHSEFLYDVLAIRAQKNIVSDILDSVVNAFNSGNISFIPKRKNGFYLDEKKAAEIQQELGRLKKIVQKPLSEIENIYEFAHEIATLTGKFGIDRNLFTNDVVEHWAEVRGFKGIAEHVINGMVDVFRIVKNHSLKSNYSPFDFENNEEEAKELYMIFKKIAIEFSVMIFDVVGRPIGDGIGKIYRMNGKVYVSRTINRKEKISCKDPQEESRSLFLKIKEIFRNGKY